nr:glycosyltransferase [Maritimibacter sp. DP1N21-5]
MRTGGIERSMIRLSPLLEEQGFRVRFLLQRAEGDLLERAGSVADLGAGGMLAAARALERELRARPVDILLSATNATNIAALIAARRLRRSAVPTAPAVIIGEHIPVRAFLATRKRPWLRPAIMRALYGGADALVAPSRPILDEHAAMLGRACPPLKELPNPVVTEVSSRPLAPQARRIVSLGRLSAEKDFALALRVMAELPDDFTLTLFGEGDEREALARDIASLEISERVTLAGRTENPAEAMRDADLFLCTSKVEGFGNAIVEAQSVGLPVVSVDCPFGPAILLADGAGCLVPNRDAAAIAWALSRFSEDREAREAAQGVGLARAGKYTVAASAAAYAALFSEVLAARGR